MVVIRGIRRPMFMLSIYTIEAALIVLGLSPILTCAVKKPESVNERLKMRVNFFMLFLFKFKLLVF
jgi:hypothetical protein